jgi:AcrR family transcriptional regulator
VNTSYGKDSLVWERPEPRRRATPVALSRDAITGAAIRVADGHGIEALSIRKVAAELGAAPMRLYDYVAAKDELLDLMVDAVYAQIATASQTAVGSSGGRGWRVGVLAIAHATRGAALEHEWFTDLLGGRPYLGPHALSVLEATAAALGRAPGLGDTDRLQRALGVLNAFLIGTLRSEVAVRRTTRSTGVDERGWQAEAAPYLGRMFATGRYPTLARLVHEASHPDADDEFTRGLTLVLAGITAPVS